MKSRIFKRKITDYGIIPSWRTNARSEPVEVRIATVPVEDTFTTKFRLKYGIKTTIMKTRFLLSVILLCTFQELLAQADPNAVSRYNTWIIPIDRGPAIKGFLYEVKDSSVVISYSTLKSDYVAGKFSAREYRAEDIKEILFRKPGTQGASILAGGIAGALIGVLVGLTAKPHGGSDDMEESYNKGAMVVFPLLFTGIGVGMGAMFGAMKTKVPVRGSQAQFNQGKDKMEDYSILYSLNDKRFAQATFSPLKDSVTDADGNVYHLRALGGQVWMAEDLMSEHFADTSEISGVKANEPGKGTLYNWQAVKDHRKICPAGYHVPSQGEWTSLFNSLGGEKYAASKIKNGFAMHDQDGLWWSSTEFDPTHGQSFYINTDTHAAMLRSTTKTAELHVRCIRNQ